ncbi:pantoate--beta-alanine ligase [Desulfuribacillus alkaliarsenatis]|uniref:pantoate--beta-alanine ligase n=1 Tax=Desulfuribacillus alkaliarsenatis TaxID=766136 RepID=UPI000A6A3015|nr:pantoate--beta-alanine ligase [Desulfuribacillus alkaliarsenatis]
MLPIIYTIPEIREAVQKLRMQNKKIGFVPTMGYLHDGHISLIEQSKQENDATIVSIFVNPTQFGENEDFSSYPRDLRRDISLINDSIDYLFVPTVDVMYPGTSYTNVIVNHFTDGLCGDSRPGHFNGVSTVVTKLLNIVTPDCAYFGQKDIQQLLVIKQLVKDLNINTTIKSCPIIREKDGLAMSSRNVYLTDDQRKQATIIYKSLQLAKELVAKGVSDADTITSTVQKAISSASLARIDYIELRDIDTWEQSKTINNTKAVLAVAVFFGSTRLIDNIILEKGSA